MRKIAGPGHSSYSFADYDAITNPTGTVYTAQWGNDVQDELMGIQDEFSIAEAAGSNKYVLAAIKGIAAAYGKQVGELFFMNSLKDPAEFDEDSPDSFFPAICLDAIETYSDISATNWSALVTHMRTLRLTYLEGKTGEKYALDVTRVGDFKQCRNTNICKYRSRKCRTFAALLEDKLVHGSYTAWRTITLGSAIGDITAGDYAITGVDSAARTITFAFTASNNSGSGTFTASFYHHRVAGSSTTARLFEATARTLVSAGDAENIAGLRRRDRMQGFNVYIMNTNGGTGGLTADNTLNLYGNYGHADVASYGKSSDPIADTHGNGTPRTGTTTDPRSAVGHLYIWGRVFNAA